MKECSFTGVPKTEEHVESILRRAHFNECPVWKSNDGGPGVVEPSTGYVIRIDADDEPLIHRWNDGRKVGKICTIPYIL
jgi:hypothetical protein